MKIPQLSDGVHYVSHGSPILPDGAQAYGSECRAAIVTESPGGVILGLCVLNPTGLFFKDTVLHGDPADPRPDKMTALCDGLDREGGTWHWAPGQDA